MIICLIDQLFFFRRMSIFIDIHLQSCRKNLLWNDHSINERGNFFFKEMKPLMIWSKNPENFVRNEQMKENISNAIDDHWLMREKLFKQIDRFSSTIQINSNSHRSEKSNRRQIKTKVRVIVFSLLEGRNLFLFCSECYFSSKWSIWTIGFNTFL